MDLLTLHAVADDTWTTVLPVKTGRVNVSKSHLLSVPQCLLLFGTERDKDPELKRP